MKRTRKSEVEPLSGAAGECKTQHQLIISLMTSFSAPWQFDLFYFKLFCSITHSVTYSLHFLFCCFTRM